MLIVRVKGQWSNSISYIFKMKIYDVVGVGVQVWTIYSPLFPTLMYQSRCVFLSRKHARYMQGQGYNLSSTKGSWLPNQSIDVTEIETQLKNLKRYSGWSKESVIAIKK